MEWIPIVFLTFKVLVLVTGMFFAVKWHYDKGRKEKGALLRAGAKVTGAVVLGLLGLTLYIFFLIRVLGL